MFKNDFLYILRMKSQAITNENLRVIQVKHERATITRPNR